MDETCDYCGELLGARFSLRAVGFATLTDGGPESPSVKAWCGTCNTPDDIDPAAHAALKGAIAAQAGSTA